MDPETAAVRQLLLPDAQFSDRFAVTAFDQALDAETAARRIMGRSPGWVGRLMGLRNRLVRPLGLKTELAEDHSPTARIGTFPVINRGPGHVVLGLNDRHLDFRVVVQVTELGGGRQEVSALTLVHTHNVLGRIYLAIVKPFHKLIVPAMLSQVARA